MPWETVVWMLLRRSVVNPLGLLTNQKCLNGNEENLKVTILVMVAELLGNKVVVEQPDSSLFFHVDRTRRWCDGETIRKYKVPACQVYSQTQSVYPPAPFPVIHPPCLLVSFLALYLSLFLSLFLCLLPSTPIRPCYHPPSHSSQTADPTSAPPRSNIMCTRRAM